MYESRKRFDMVSNLPEKVFEEVRKILDSIQDSPASKVFVLSGKKFTINSSKPRVGIIIYLK